MRILLIEDDQEICEAVREQLLQEGYMVDVCYHGSDAIYYVCKESYDAVVLDRLLPGVDGIAILKYMRKENIKTPVIMATAMGMVTDRIEGLDCGADDYIIKPYDILELTARIRALIRRPASIEEVDNLSYADLVFHRNERVLSCHNNSFPLSKKEALMVEFLMQNAEKALSREVVFAHVWGADSEVESGNLDNYIHFLRKRLKALNSTAEIVTVHSFGYRLQKPATSKEKTI